MIDLGEFPPLFVKCQCGSEAFEIRRYDYRDGDLESEDYGFYLSFWKYGRGKHSLGWRERLRWCWRILRSGDPWADSIIASDEDTMKISEYIRGHISNGKDENKSK